jgi:hypothetical protein
MRAALLRLDSLTLVLALGVAVSACQATAPRAAAPDLPDVEWRTMPLMVGGVLYASTSLSQVSPARYSSPQEGRVTSLRSAFDRPWAQIFSLALDAAELVALTLP